jgi:hypothetical protein
MYNNNQQKRTRSERKTYEPKYTDFQISLAESIAQQAIEFGALLPTFAEMEGKARRAEEEKLFSLTNAEETGRWEFLTDADGTEYKAYLLYRSVRTDRESHELIRASCTIVLNYAETGEPAFLVDAYANARGGCVSVTPYTNQPDDIKNTYRSNFKFTED